MELIYPIVPNLYTILTLTPEEANCFIVLDLKDVFFCIPWHRNTPFCLLADKLQNKKKPDNTPGPDFLKDSGTAHIFWKCLSIRFERNTFIEWIHSQ